MIEPSRSTHTIPLKVWLHVVFRTPIFFFGMAFVLAIAAIAVDATDHNHDRQFFGVQVFTLLAVAAVACSAGAAAAQIRTMVRSARVRPPDTESGS